MLAGACIMLPFRHHVSDMSYNMNVRTEVDCLLSLRHAASELLHAARQEAAINPQSGDGDKAQAIRKFINGTDQRLEQRLQLHQPLPTSDL